jgi:CHAT domain-containing protein
MRPADTHLTPQELEFLLFGTADSTTTTADSAAAQEAQQHLSGCAVCQSVADKYRNADAALKGLGTRNNRASKAPTRGTDCPADETWLRLAAGLISDEEAARYVTHAAQCDWCGPLFRESMEDLAQDVTAEEQEALNKLPSASAGWQREMGKKLAAVSGNAAVTPVVKVDKPAKSREKAGFGWWPKLVWAGAGLAVVVVAVGIGIRLTREPDVNQLLAQAYTEQRTIELRFPGAAYGPMRVERGGGKRDLPAQFYTAQGVIKTELAKHPEDPAWLQAQARAHLLEWNYEKAIQELDDALMLKPNDPGLLTDKATALVQRAEKIGPQAQINYGEAAEVLSQVLKTHPDDPVALFNRAIIYEKLPAPNESIQDLKHYLRIEPAGRWADEARDRLQRLEKLIKTHDDALAEPLASPYMLVRLAGDPAALAHVDERIEDYQDLAILEWLPTAFPAKPEPENSAKALAALRVLADLLADRHSDKWLNDLLDSSNNSSAFVSAVDALSEAVHRSNDGDATRAYFESEKAESFFVKAGNRAGTQRAEAEQVHALQRSQHGDQCLAKATLAEATLQEADYPWINAQLDIDKCSCSIMLGKFNQARSFIIRAEKAANDGRFRTLQLRRIGIAAAVETDEGNLAGAWADDAQGLADYWKNQFSPPIRGHQFYTDLSLAAEELRQWSLSLAMGQEGARAISRTGNKSSEALTRALVGRAAFRALDLELASAEFNKSNNLLSELPPSESTRTYRMDAEIDLAGVELEEGKFSRAEDRLKALRESLDGVRSFTIPLRFHETYGKLLANQNRPREAEAAFMNAVDIADSSLQQLDDPSDRYTWNQETSNLYRQLVQLEIKNGDPGRALAVWERYRAATLHTTTISGDRFAPFEGEINKIVSTFADQTVISYAVLPQGLAVWVFDDRGLRGRFSELNSVDLINMTSYFADMCADPRSDISRLKLRAAALYKLLIGPIAGQLTPARTVVIESDDVFGDLPFEALVMPNNQYWGSDFRIVSSPGLLFQQHLRADSAITPAARTLVVASGNDGGGPSSGGITTQVQAEAEAVAGKFFKPILLQGGDASAARIEASLPTAEIFHFAGHGISTGTQEGLWLVKDSSTGRREASVWGAEHINSHLFRHLQLAVFAACSTGQSNRSRFETHGGIVRTALFAGVPHVIASRWDVDSAATMEFMELFYNEILSGKPVSTAAKISETALRNQPETQHPYYWAAFAAFGRNN